VGPLAANQQVSRQQTARAREESRMKYGIIAGILDPDLETAFRMGQELGFDGLEMSFNELDYEKALLWTHEGVQQIRRLAEATGLEVPSCCAGRYNRRGFVNPDPAVREECVAIMLHLIDTCADVGMDNILVAFFGDHQIETDEHKDLVVEAMKRCAPKAESRGITLALEGTVTAEEFMEIIERADSEALGVYYDVGNAVWLGYDGPAELRKLSDAGLLRQIHIKDMTVDKSNVPLGEPVAAGSDRLRSPGEGGVDWPAVAEAIRDIGYDGYLVLETTGGDDRRAFAQRHLAFIKGYLEG
jgi:L-ribulose-5-phosphate 3-epimerase